MSLFLFTPRSKNFSCGWDFDFFDMILVYFKSSEDTGEYERIYIATDSSFSHYRFFFVYVFTFKLPDGLCR